MAENEDFRDGDIDGPGTAADALPALIGTNTPGLGVLVKAEFDAAMLFARQNPRNITRAAQALMTMVRLDEETAKEAVYALPPRKGSNSKKDIQGPSIRYAELVMSCWGNMRAASRIIEEGKEFVTAQGICIDLERNCHTSIEIPRRILTNTGRRYSTDMIQQTAGAASSIARRNAVLGNVPKPFWAPAYKECIFAIVGKPETFRARLEDVYRAFAKWNVTPEMLADVLGHGPDPARIVIDDLVTLRGIYNAIHTEDQTVDSIFRPEKAAAGPGEGGGYQPLRRGASRAQEDEPREEAKGPAAPPAAGTAPAQGAAQPAGDAGGDAVAGAEGQGRKARAPRKAKGGEPASPPAAKDGAGEARGGDGIAGAAAVPGAQAGAAGVAAPAADILTELAKAVREVTDEAALESISDTFGELLQGKMNAEEEAYVEKLFSDRLNELAAAKAAAQTAAREPEWDPEEAGKEIAAAIAEAKDSAQLADVAKAIAAGREALVKAGRGDIDDAIGKQLEAKAASFAPRPAKIEDAPAGTPPEEEWKRFDAMGYRPRDPSRFEKWKEIITAMASATTKQGVTDAMAIYKDIVTAWGEDTGNLAAIRFTLRGKRT